MPERSPFDDPVQETPPYKRINELVAAGRQLEAEVERLREALEAMRLHVEMPAGESWEQAYNELAEMIRLAAVEGGKDDQAQGPEKVKAGECYEDDDCAMFACPRCHEDRVRREGQR